MAFTGKLGSPDSQLGLIVLGLGATTSLSIVGSTGIPSTEAFGANQGNGISGGLVLKPPPNIVGFVGIPSEEAFGAGGTVLNPPPNIVGLAGIPSAEAFGAGGIVLKAGLNIVGTTGVPSAEAFGSGGRVYTDLFPFGPSSSGAARIWWWNEAEDKL